MSRKSKSKSQKTGAKSPEDRRAQSVKELRRSGIQAFRAGRYHEAVVNWSEAYQRDPTEVWGERLAEAYFRRGLSFYPADKLEQVISDLHWAVKLRPQSPLYHYHLGLAYHRRRNFERAVAYYGQALELAPEINRYRYHFGLACIDGGLHIEAARQMFTALAAAEPTNVQWKYPLAVIFLKEGEWDKAVQYLEDLWSQENHAAPTAALLGLAHLQQGHLQLAQAWLEKAIEGWATRGDSDPKSSRAVGAIWYYRGLVQVQGGDIAAAQRSWEQAYRFGFRSNQLEANLATAWRWAGAEALREGRLAEAVQYWEQAVALGARDKRSQRDLTHLYFLYAHQLAAEGRLEEAAEYYEKVAERERSTAITHNLALTYDRLGRPEKSVIYWQRVIKDWEKQLRSESQNEALRRNLNEAYKHLGKNCLKIGQDQRACRELQRALSYLPDDVETRKILAGAHISAGRYRQAGEILEQLVEEHPEDVDILVNLGVAYDLDGRQEDALDAWEEALEIQPDHPIARQQIARTIKERAQILVLMGRFDDAIEELKSKLEILGDDPEIHCQIGDLFLIRKQERQAQEHFEQAYQFDPQDVDVVLTIGKQYLLYGYSRQAEAWFDRANGLCPNDSRVLARIGICYLRAQREAQANKYFQAAIELARTDLRLLRSIAFRLFEEGYGDRVREYFERILKTDPPDAESLHRLAHCYACTGDFDKAAETLAQAEALARQQGRQDLKEAIKEDRDSGWQEYETDDEDGFPGFL